MDSFTKSASRQLMEATIQSYSLPNCIATFAIESSTNKEHRMHSVYRSKSNVESGTSKGIPTVFYNMHTWRGSPT